MVDLRRAGTISWGGYVRQAFLFEDIGVTLQQWMERAEDGDEIGVRVEIQHLAVEQPADTASEFAAKVMTLSRPIWRADIFTLTSSDPGNFDRAHYHPHFDGSQPCDRAWDQLLTQDPFAWLSDQLASVPEILEQAGAADLAGSSDPARVADMAPAIAQIAELLMTQAREADTGSIPLT